MGRVILLAMFAGGIIAAFGSHCVASEPPAIQPAAAAAATSEANLSSRLVQSSPPEMPSPEKPTSSLQPLSRGRFFVRIEEQLDGESTDRNYPEAIVSRMLTIHGFKRTKKKKRADFIIEGSMASRFLRSTEFKYKNASIRLEHQYESEGQLTVTRAGPPPSGKDSAEDKSRTPDTSGEDTAKQKTPKATTDRVRLEPKPIISGRSRKDEAKDDVRRRYATTLARAIAESLPIVDPEVAPLIKELVTVGTKRTTTEVADDFAKLGSRAVPYLLDQLLLETPCPLSGKPPYAKRRGKLMTFHVADQALRTIFKRTSPLQFPGNTGLRIETYRHWSRAWEKIQPLPKAYRVPE